MRIVRSRRLGWRITLAAAVGFTVLATQSGARAAEPQLTTEDKVALQSTMAQFIEQHSVGDAFLHVDTHTGALEKLYPVTQHPMIVRLNDVVVLCADLRTKDGKTVNADFYVTKDAGQYVIFQTEIGNREPLQALIMKGAASLLE